MDLKNLYQEVILDHNRNPRNFGELESASYQARGFNPLCGDELTLYIKLEDEVLADISFEGKGCAISTASASLLTDALKGKTKQEAEALFAKVHAMLTAAEDQDLAAVGKLAVLAGVKEFPARVKCATLAWHTLQAALGQSTEIACTE